MESVRNEEDIAFNELMQEVHQQFLCYKEKSSKRFEKLEELVDLAAQKMSILKEMKAKSREEGFVNPFVRKTKEHGNLRPSGRTTHQSLQKFKLNVPEFEDEPQDAYAILKDFQKSGPSTTNGAHLEALFNEKEWSDMDSEVSITTEKEKAVYDELPGEDKEDWHSEEIICKALGLEDFFEPKQNLEEGNSIGGKVLECISYSWQPYPSVSPAAVAYVPRQEHEELGSVRNLSIGQFKLFGVNNLFDCSLETKLLDKSTKRKIVLVAEKEIGDELNKSITPAMEESKEESDTKLWFSGIVPGHGDIPKFVGSYKVEDKQGVNEAVFSKRTINMGGIDEAFLDKMTTKYFPIADNSYSLNKKSSNIGEKNVFTFDPGGYVQNDQSKCVNKKLVEAVLIIPVDGELRHLKDIHLEFLAIDKEHSQFRRKVYVFLFVNSIGTQGQDVQNVSGETDIIISEINGQYVDYVVGLNVILYGIKYIVFSQCSPEIKKVMRLKYHKVSREGVVITIFDPGGYIIRASYAQLVGGRTGILHIEHLLQEVNRSWKCMIHHEDMVAFKEGGMSGLGS